MKLATFLLVFVGYASAVPVLYEFTGKLRQITILTDTDGRGHFTFQFPFTSAISGISVGDEGKFAFIVDVDTPPSSLAPDGSVHPLPYQFENTDYFFASLVESPFSGLHPYLPEDSYWGASRQEGQRSVLAGNSEILGGPESNRTDIARGALIETWAVGDMLFGAQLVRIDANAFEHYSYDFRLDAMTEFPSVPEPSSAVLILSGFAGLISLKRRRSHKG